MNKFCDEVEKEVPRLDVLVANAGMLTWEYTPTSDGWEQQYGLTPSPSTPFSNRLISCRLQVNHLATVQVSLLLLPLLRRTASLGSTPRLVVVSSDTHLWVDLSKEAKSDRGIIPTLNDKTTLVSPLNRRGGRRLTFSFTKKGRDQDAVPQDEDAEYLLYPGAGVTLTRKQPSDRQLRYSQSFQDRTATPIPLAAFVDIRRS